MVKKSRESDAAERQGEKMQNASSVFLFHGDDTFRAYEKLQYWRNQFELKYGDLNVHVFHGEDLTVSKFQSTVEAYPFLSEKKLIIIYDFLVKGAEDNLRGVAEILKGIGEHCLVVFFEHQSPDSRKVLYKAIQKVGKSEEFGNLNGVQLIQWIEERFKNLETQNKEGVLYSLEKKAAEYLAEMIGPNLWLLDNEIKKLVLFAQGKKISREMIDQVVSFHLTSNIFKLTDALGLRKIHEALTVLKILLDNDQSLIGILFALVAHFRVMIQAKKLLENGLTPAVIAKNLKKHPFMVNKIIHQCKFFSEGEIRRIYQKLAHIDADLKTGKVRMVGGDASELQRALEVMFVELR